MLLEAAEIMFTGAKEREAQKEERLLPPEMLLTPGEKEAVKEVERKMSKSGFGTTIRIIYLGKKEVFFKPHIGLPISFLLTFNTGNLNRFGTFNPTSTKVKSVWLWFLDKRRAFLRQRRAFRNYKTRVNPMFPKNGGISILNSEELATIFHFPSRAMASAPLVPRIESRKGEAPPGLPID